jgi:hypothetical protein
MLELFQQNSGAIGVGAIAGSDPIKQIQGNSKGEKLICVDCSCIGFGCDAQTDIGAVKTIGVITKTAKTRTFCN